MEYLEEHARSIPDKEDYVPYVPGQKRGKIFKKEMPKQTYSALEPDIEDALKDIDGADLSELAEILGEGTIQRFSKNSFLTHSCKINPFHLNTFSIAISFSPI